MKNFAKIIFLLILLLLCVGVNAQEFYANLTFQVQSEGSTIISGTTNSLNLSLKTTQELTFKNGKTWTFLIDNNELFSEYTYKIILPINSQVQKIETNSTYFVSTENTNIVIEGFGENTTLNLKINYTINQQQSEMQWILIISGILILIALGVGAFIIFKKYNANTKPNQKETLKTIENTFDKNALTERQLAIVEQLEKKNGQNTQSEIQKTLKLPKASLFRNISTLEKKGIVKKERKGMTMLLTLIKKRE